MKAKVIVGIIFLFGSFLIGLCIGLNYRYQHIVEIAMPWDAVEAKIESNNKKLPYGASPDFKQYGRLMYMEFPAAFNDVLYTKLNKAGLLDNFGYDSYMPFQIAMSFPEGIEQMPSAFPVYVISDGIGVNYFMLGWIDQFTRQTPVVTSLGGG